MHVPNASSLYLTKTPLPSAEAQFGVKLARPVVTTDTFVALCFEPFGKKI